MGTPIPLRSRELAATRSSEIIKYQRYIISHSEGSKQSCSAKMGGAALARFLKTKGAKLGKYPLTHNKAKGYWEAHAGGY